MIGSKMAIMEMQRIATAKMEKAKALEAEGKLQEAAGVMRQIAKVIREMAEREVVQAERVRRYQKARIAEEKAAILESGKPVFRAEDGAVADSLPAAAEYRATVDELVYRSSVTWDDIAGMEDVKKSLKNAMGLMLARMPDGVNLNVASRILLYGPPGTGKTLLAAACSNMLGATFFNVKSSDLLNKWFGESSKLISALFARARSIADTGVSVVFIDEFDGLCRARGEQGETGAERRILSTLLSELEGLTEKGEAARVITIVATNQPWDIDEAILERFKRHVFVGLPDMESRARIFEIHLRKYGLALDGTSYRQLAEKTEGYSGRLIERVGQYAVDRMVADANPKVPALVDKGRITDYEVNVRPLDTDDFAYALEKVKPVTSGAMLQNLKKYQARVGGEQT